MALQPAGRRRGAGLTTGPGPEPGAYLLVLAVEASRRVEAGALGAVELEPGRYAYAGSALGPGGVRARLLRHVRRRGPRHWHVDHLRGAARPVSAWWVHGEERLECRWAAALAALPGAGRPTPGFGASDCGCPGHLVRLPADRAKAELRAVLARTISGGRTPRRIEATDLEGAAGETTGGDA